MATKRNLLFIMLDQLRFDSIACNGNTVIHTPNIDRIAKSGISFQQYYSNTPVCVPSRCSLFTGRYLHSHQVRENHTLLEAGREIHLFRVLKQAGYQLGYMGKNHLLQDCEFENFDCIDVENLNHQKTQTEQKYYEFGRKCHHNMDLYGCWAGTGYFEFPKEETSLYRYATSTCNFIKEQTSENPFCACLSILEPHAPHIAPKELEEQYQNAVDSVPESSVKELEEKASRYCIKYLAQQSDKATQQDRKRFIAMYYSMITFVDEQVGRVLDTLQQSGLEDNTLIVFTSDHGEFLFDHGMCKKDLVLCDSLLHVPLLMSCPDVLSENKKVDTMMEEIDVVPTILDLLEIDIPFGVQGKSVVPYLQGKTDQHKAAVYAEVCPPWLYNPFKNFTEFSDFWRKEKRSTVVPFNVPGDYTKSVRNKNYRYVWYGTGEEELYDLTIDPHERHNVATQPEYQEIKMKLQLQLGQWHMYSEDPIDSKFFDMLQKQYCNWVPAKKITEDTNHGPYWMDYRWQYIERLDKVF